MRRYIVVLLSTIVLAGSVLAFAQTETITDPNDAAFWVDRWARSPAILYGADETAFYQGMQVVQFPLNVDNNPSNPEALDSNVQWLQAHPNVRFYINGYASMVGDWIHNLGLAQRRADWVKATLVSRGISEDRIKVASGWGEIYPACEESNDACWNRNQVVRFSFSPD